MPSLALSPTRLAEPQAFVATLSAMVPCARAAAAGTSPMTDNRRCCSLPIRCHAQLHFCFVYQSHLCTTGREHHSHPVTATNNADFDARADNVNRHAADDQFCVSILESLTAVVKHGRIRTMRWPFFWKRAATNSTTGMPPDLRASFERDLEDDLILTKELFTLQWMLNPAIKAAFTCHKFTQNIDEGTTDRERAYVVTQALEVIEFPPIDSFENDFRDYVNQYCREELSELVFQAVSLYPECEDKLRKVSCGEEKRLAGAYPEMAISVIAKQRPLYDQLIVLRNQLHEFLPRYAGILSRNTLAEEVTKFVAGFISGYFGAGPLVPCAIDAWANWRDTNDAEFVKKFAMAFTLLLKGCIDYSNESAFALSIVFDRLLDEVRQLHQRLFDTYNEMAGAGMDIRPLYNTYHELSPRFSEEACVLLENAIRSLEGNRRVSYRTIENLRNRLSLKSIERLDQNKCV